MADQGPASLDSRLDAIGRQPFRARFHLRGRERALAESAGPVTMRRHAADLIGKRLAPASPLNDGKQTPYRGHPVFVAAPARDVRHVLPVVSLLRWHEIRSRAGADRWWSGRMWWSARGHPDAGMVIIRWMQRELRGRGG